jgi:hypothetical protein
MRVIITIAHFRQLMNPISHLPSRKTYGQLIRERHMDNSFVHTIGDIHVNRMIFMENLDKISIHLKLN